MPPKKRIQLLDSLSPDEWNRYYFALVAKDKQLPPENDIRHWLLLCGRGYGKTFTGANYVKKRVESGTTKKMIIAGQTLDQVVENQIKSALLPLYDNYPNDKKPKFIYGNNPRIDFPNGAKAIIRTGEKPDSFRGHNIDCYWADEIAYWKYPVAFAELTRTMRLGPNCQGIITTTPRPIPLLTNIVKDSLEPNSNILVTHGTTYENVEFLGEEYIREMELNYTETQRRQEMLGEIVDDAPDALFHRNTLDDNRVRSLPSEEFRRVIVAVDPASTSNKSSDETGIIVAGIGQDKRFYVINDFSGRYTPQQWAEKAIHVHNLYKSDKIIAESNQGGEMVSSTLKTIDSCIPVKLIHATRGKQVRAEPISALYEQNRVSHIGAFPKLEDEMCTWIPGISRRSPNRLDALVYALLELSGKMNYANSACFQLLSAHSERAYYK